VPALADAKDADRSRDASAAFTPAAQSCSVQRMRVFVTDAEEPCSCSCSTRNESQRRREASRGQRASSAVLIQRPARESSAALASAAVAYAWIASPTASADCIRAAANSSNVRHLDPSAPNAPRLASAARCARTGFRERERT